MELFICLLAVIIIISSLYFFDYLLLRISKHKGKQYYSEIIKMDSYSYALFQDNKIMNCIKLYLGNYKYYKFVQEFINTYGNKNK